MGQLFSSDARSRRVDITVHGGKATSSRAKKQAGATDKTAAPVSRLSGPSADLLLYAELGIQNVEPVVGVLSLVDASTVLKGKGGEGGGEGKRRFSLRSLRKKGARRGGRKKSYWRNPNFDADTPVDPNDFGAFVDEDQGLPWQTKFRGFDRSPDNQSCAGVLDEKEHIAMHGKMNSKWENRRSALRDPERYRDPNIPGAVAISIGSASTRSMETCDISHSSDIPSTPSHSSPPSSPVPDSTKDGSARPPASNQSIARREPHLEKVVLSSPSISSPPPYDLRRGSSAATKESCNSAGNSSKDSKESFRSKQSSSSNHSFGTWSSSSAGGISRKIRLEPALVLFGRNKRTASPYASLETVVNNVEDPSTAHFASSPSHHLNYSVLESIDENASIDEEKKSVQSGEEDDSLMNFSSCVFGEEESKGCRRETASRKVLGSVVEEEKRNTWEYDEDEVSALSLSRCTESQIGIDPKEVARSRSSDSLHLQFDVGSGRVLAVDSFASDSYGSWSMSAVSRR